MNNEEPNEDIDRVLEVLSRPISRYILSVLAGVYPGFFTEELEGQGDNHENERQS